MRFVFIRAEKANFSVFTMCRVLCVSTTGYYAWLKRKPPVRDRNRDELDRSNALFPDLHVAIVTADMGAGNFAECMGSIPFGDRAEFKVKAGCGLADGASFLSVEGARDRGNFTGDAAAALGCLFEVGHEGCGFIQPLLAAAIARDTKRNPNGAGFFRKDASLTFVFVTSDDDYSAIEPQSFFGQARPGENRKLRCAREGHTCAGMIGPAADFSVALDRCVATDDDLVPLVDLDKVAAALIGDHPDAAVMVMAGWPVEPEKSLYKIVQGPSGFVLDPVCSPSTGPATPPLRLKGLVDRLGSRGRIASVCNDDWRLPLESLVNLLNR